MAVEHADFAGLRGKAIDLLARLIAHDTTSSKPNIALVREIATYLADLGIAAELVPTADGQKASLFATVGPAGISGIGLSGHTDVVPVAAQTWTSDPFTLDCRDARYYGRGTADMKGFVACVLAAVPVFLARPLATPIHIILSYDEETGCTGVRPLIAELGRRLTKPRAVIVGEPTSMRVVDAHKGPVRWSADVSGRAAHASMAPLGVNAISYAGRLLSELARVEADLKGSTQDDRFLPPYSTLQVTEISGGTAANIIPSECRVGFEMRALPDLDIERIEQRLQRAAEPWTREMQATAAESGMRIRQTNRVPPFAAGENSEAVALALRLTGQNRTSAVSYATEAGLFQAAGVPAVVCGPGDIAQAHTADEWIAAEQLDACLDFLTRLADWAANP